MEYKQNLAATAAVPDLPSKPKLCAKIYLNLKHITQGSG